VGGTSFGGIETVLGAERGDYCAAIDSSGGAQSWTEAPELRSLMIQAVRNSRAPIFFFQAANDFDLSPSKTLSAEMKEAGKTYEVKIYPPFGNSAGDGHTFWILRMGRRRVPISGPALHQVAEIQVKHSPLPSRIELCGVAPARLGSVGRPR
jgi:hypothetical protein